MLARLAVDSLGTGTASPAVSSVTRALRVAQAADAIEIRGIVVHAGSEKAKEFYYPLASTRVPVSHDADGDYVRYSRSSFHDGVNAAVFLSYRVTPVEVK